MQLIRMNTPQSRLKNMFNYWSLLIFATIWFLNNYKIIIQVITILWVRYSQLCKGKCFLIKFRIILSLMSIHNRSLHCSLHSSLNNLKTPLNKKINSQLIEINVKKKQSKKIILLLNSNKIELKIKVKNRIFN